MYADGTALRGHASIQGSTDIPTLFNLLPGYLHMPRATEDDLTLEAYLKSKGVAALMTEYGFTIGTEDEERQHALRRAHRLVVGAGHGCLDHVTAGLAGGFAAATAASASRSWRAAE